MYAEAKLGVAGESTSLRSPEDPDEINACMLFYYSLYVGTESQSILYTFEILASWWNTITED